MANKHTTPTGETQRERILAFVRANPECTTKQIREALGLSLVAIGQCLIRLRDAGLVVSEWLRYEPQTWRATGQHDKPTPNKTLWAAALGI